MRDRLTAALILIVGVGLIAAMPTWWSSERPAPGAYAAPPDFSQRVEAMVASHATGAEIDGMPVVRPPPGDVWLRAERWRFYPVLELEAGREYRLHVASADVPHAIVLNGVERPLPPGLVQILPLTPTDEVVMTLQCSEYCGLPHTRMRGKIVVVKAN